MITMRNPLLFIVLAALSFPQCICLSPLRSAHKICKSRSTSTNSNSLPNTRRQGKGTTRLHSSRQPEQQPELKQYLPPPPPPEELYIPRTQTQLQLTPVASIPQRPKIVIFGATSSIGRSIIQTLLDSKVDVEVVAFVKDCNEWFAPDKENKVYANLIQQKGRGASLNVMEGDLLSIENVTYTLDGLGYNTTAEEAHLEIYQYNSDQIMAAISECTAIISCLQPSRSTDFYTDYLRVPITRIWNHNVSSWCLDEGHPYYVYLANRRIVQEAEAEQARRQTAIEVERERRRLKEELEERRASTDDSGFDSSIVKELRRKRQRLGKRDTYSTSQLFEDLIARNTSMPLQSAGLKDRIKFIRIGDVNIGKNPWRLGNVLTNVFSSVAMRYEELSERLLKESTLLDTVVLRVGEIVREERNVNNTSLQLSTSGVVPSPSVVGIDDVSELAAVASLTKIHDPRYSGDMQQRISTANAEEDGPLPASKHFTWAVRWAGQHLSPPQGLRPDGSSSAALCFVKAMQAEMARARQKQIDAMKKEKLKLYHGGRQLIRLRRWLKAPWRIKPYALTSILTVYMTLAAVGWMLIGKQVVDLATWLKQLNTAQMITKLLS